MKIIFIFSRDHEHIPIQPDPKPTDVRTSDWVLDCVKQKKLIFYRLCSYIFLLL